MSFVYVIQDFGDKNLLPAKRYGEVRVLLPPNRQIVFSSAPTVRRLREGLKNFSDEDYLLLIGDPAAIGIATSIASENNRGRYTLLKWDRQEAEYYDIKVDLRNYGESENYD
tara:strand:+ start:2794 stop:3129 length:336 start_codon:yes stop_codon:yes gene_type:complete